MSTYILQVVVVFRSRGLSHWDYFPKRKSFPLRYVRLTFPLTMPDAGTVWLGRPSFPIPRSYYSATRHVWGLSGRFFGVDSGARCSARDKKARGWVVSAVEPLYKYWTPGAAAEPESEIVRTNSGTWKSICFRTLEVNLFFLDEALSSYEHSIKARYSLGADVT